MQGKNGNRVLVFDGEVTLITHRSASGGLMFAFNSSLFDGDDDKPDVSVHCEVILEKEDLDQLERMKSQGLL